MKPTHKIPVHKKDSSTISSLLFAVVVVAIVVVLAVSLHPKTTKVAVKTHNHSHHLVHHKSK